MSQQPSSRRSQMRTNGAHTFYENENDNDNENEGLPSGWQFPFSLSLKILSNYSVHHESPHAPLQNGELQICNIGVIGKGVAFGEKSYKSKQIYQIIMFNLNRFVRFLPNRALLDIIR